MNIDLEGKLNGLGVNDFVGESVAVLGIKGSGKSNTVAVLAEEGLANGLPMTIVDLEGEYWGLKEKYPILVAGQSANVDLAVTEDQAAALASFSLENGVSVILDVSGFRVAEERLAFLYTYLNQLWQANWELRKPYQIIIDEARRIIPQSGSNDLKKLIIEMAQGGRKRGIGLVVATQRASNIDKDILTQCGIMFLMRTVYSTDFEVYWKNIPDTEKTAKQAFAAIKALKPGQAVVVMQDKSGVVQIRPRHTYHAGATPTLGTSQPTMPLLQGVDQALLDQLKTALSQNATAPIEPVQRSNPAHLAEIARLTTANESLTTALATANKTIEALQADIELLSKLKVEMGELPDIQVNIPALSLPQSGGAAATLPAIAPLVATESEDEPYRTTLALTRAINRQRNNFQGLMRILKGMPNKKRNIEILAFLNEQPTQEFDMSTVARRLGYMESTLSGNHPLPLVRAGLVTRRKWGNAYRYKSKLDLELSSRFPDLDTEALIDEILALQK